MNAAARLAPRALYEEVAERLRQRIYARELSPGDWIDEQVSDIRRKARGEDATTVSAPPLPGDAG